MSADPRRLKALDTLGPEGPGGPAMLARALCQPKPYPLADLFRALRALQERPDTRDLRALRETALADNPPPGLEAEQARWWPLHRLGLSEATFALAMESPAARAFDPELRKIHARMTASPGPLRRLWIPLTLVPLLVVVALTVVTEPRLVFIPLLLLWILPWWKVRRKRRT